MEQITTHSKEILVAILVLINVFSFFVMANDKRKSVGRQDSERTPEGLIFFIATAFGSIGVYVGMLLFRHKTRKWYFQLGVPLLIMQNIATAYVIWSGVV